jgi:hypothetical protein
MYGGTLVLDEAGLASRRVGKFEAGISHMEQETAPGGRARHGPAIGMDGGGIRPLSQLHKK